MITEQDMLYAFEAGRQSATIEQWVIPEGSPQVCKMYEHWRRCFYFCQDCGQDLLGIGRHECPARLPAHPYRAKGTTP